MKNARKAGKRTKPKESRRGPMALIEHKGYERHTIEFPQVKGRVVDSIGFFTMENHHDLTIQFRDKTVLYLKIDPCYSLQAILGKQTQEGLHVTEAWPTISLEA